MTLAYDVTTIRNPMLDIVTSAVGNGGLVRFYDGARPATGGAATTLLAELVGGTPWAAGAAAGVLTAGAIAQDASANATGTATWGRVLTAGAAFRFDFSIGTSGSDMNLTTTSIVATQPVSISSWTITEGNP